LNGPAFWISLVAAEVVLVVFVLLLVYWIRNIGAARRDREAVNRLVKDVRKQKGEREAAVTAFLSDEMGLADEALASTTAAILREEFRLVQAFASVYSDRDSRSAANFRLNLEQAVAPYFGLKGTVMAGGAGDAAEIEALRRENARLSQELTVTMDTMSRMLTEYSGMFANNEADEKLSNEEPVAIATAAIPAEDVPVQVAAEPQDTEARIEAPPTEEAEANDVEPEATEEQPVLATQPEMDVEQDAEDAVDQSIAEEVIGKSDETLAEMAHDDTEARDAAAVEPQINPIEEVAQPEVGAVVELPSQSEPVNEEPDPGVNEVVDLELESREESVEPVDLGEVVELVPEEPADGESKDTAVDLMAEPVEDDEIDSLIDAGPLEDELGDLFDSDDIDVLDDLPDEAGDAKADQKIIAI